MEKREAMLRKIIISLLLLAALDASVPGEIMAGYRIGVLFYSEEPRYASAFAGIKKELAKSGFREPKTTFILGNAAGSKAKAAEIVRSFSERQLSLIITLGTNATIMAAHEIYDVPIVFCMVYDPVKVRVARDWRSSARNTTGVSPRIEMSELIKRLSEIRPPRRIAVLYTPGEKNTEVQMKELQALQEKMAFKVVPVIIASQKEIQQVLADVLPTVDTLYFTGSSIAGTNIPAITALAAKARVISVTHLEDLVEGGVMLAVAADPYKLGVMAGKKAVAVLRGAPPESIPLEYMKAPQLYLNRKTAAATGIKLPELLVRRAEKIFE